MSADDDYKKFQSDLMKVFEQTYGSDMYTVDRIIFEDSKFGPTIEPIKPAVKKAPPKVTWDDIGGLEDAKKALRRAIELPLLHPEVYAKHNRFPSRGVLLYGPPGCGKTHLSRAVAGVVGDGGRDSFIYVKSTELMQSYVGEGERSVRDLFSRAKDYKKRTGKQSVIFIDEADAVLGHRHGRMTINSYLVPTFLAEMDGSEESGAYVILATNRQDDIDEAILRDERISNKIYVGRPDRTTSEKILLLHSKDAFCEDKQAFAKAVTARLFEGPVFFKYQPSGESTWATFSLADCVNGAMLKGLVRRATDFAIEREIEGGAAGLNTSDAEAAVDEAFKEKSAAGVISPLLEHLRDRGIHEAIIMKPESAELMDVEVDGMKMKTRPAGGGALN